MTVVYRAIWDDRRCELLADARDQFERWLVSKQIRLPLPDEGEASDHKNALRATRVEESGVQAVRFELSQDSGHERWKTTLLAMRSGETQHLWVDLEWDCEDVFARPPSSVPLVSPVN